MTATTVAPTFDRSALLARLESAWRRSDQVFDLLEPGALLVRPIALRQPFIFYVGHLAAFGWNQVLGGLLGRASPHPDLDALFARGIDPVGVDRYEGAESWPSLAETLAYRDGVRAALREAVDEVAARAGTDELADHGRVYHLVIEHELMHHETLLYMMQQLDRRWLRRPGDVPAYVFGGAAAAGAVNVAGRDVVLGERMDRVPFGWDNEFPEHHEAVAAFTMDRTPVRQGEWLEFMAAGGYARGELWAPEDFAWKERVGHGHPAFWVREGGRWLYQTLFDRLPLEETLDWPVWVSGAEARAYATWRGAALPTEAEFHAAADDAGVRWGAPGAGNFGFQHWAPTPVGMYSGAGALDLVGNGWEWTRTRFAPFPGFRAWARTYPGYSADFFDEHHDVILGGSWATDGALVRRSFRNWFQPHYPYVFAKFRLVRR